MSEISEKTLEAIVLILRAVEPELIDAVKKIVRENEGEPGGNVMGGSAHGTLRGGVSGEEGQRILMVLQAYCESMGETHRVRGVQMNFVVHEWQGFLESHRRSEE